MARFPAASRQALSPGSPASKTPPPRAQPASKTSPPRSPPGRKARSAPPSPASSLPSTPRARTKSRFMKVTLDPGLTSPVYNLKSHGLVLQFTCANRSSKPWLSKQPSEASPRKSSAAFVVSRNYQKHQENADLPSPRSGGSGREDTPKKTLMKEAATARMLYENDPEGSYLYDC